jgi:hypothetical protein
MTSQIVDTVAPRQGRGMLASTRFAYRRRLMRTLRAVQANSHSNLIHSATRLVLGLVKGQIRVELALRRAIRSGKRTNAR